MLPNDLGRQGDSNGAAKLYFDVAQMEFFAHYLE